MKRVTVGIAVLPEALSVSAIAAGGLLLGAAEVARSGDLRADAEAALSALGKRVTGIARGKFRAAIGWGGPSVLAVVETNGAGGKARDSAVRSALEAEAGRSLDGWRIARAPESRRKRGRILAGAVPEDEILSVNAAVEAAGGEVAWADLLPLVLADAVQSHDVKQEASVVVLIPGSVSMFLMDGKGMTAACRHRALNGGEAEDRAETEVLRGLVAWEGAGGEVPRRVNLIDAVGLPGFVERLAERVAVPVRAVSLEDLLRKNGPSGMKAAPGTLLSISAMAAVTARRACR